MSVCFLQAQTTIGLLYNDMNVSDGYTLFGYKQANDVYLINNCGEVVNHWLTNNRLGVAYILEDGTLLKSGGNHLEIRDWDNNLLWEVDLSSFGLTQHHDIEPLPNGNILVLSRDFYTEADAIDNGRSPSTAPSGLSAEKIVEIKPAGANSLTIEWEWKIWDHLIQDFNSSVQNYGVVANHPELLNINLGSSSGNWIHANGLDYNKDLDQIVFSSRKMNEIYIIDHSTTTAEAASHSGGNSNKGGDFLWRWGNPVNYGQGLISDQKFYGQHDPKWILPGYPDAGKISVFNNGFGRVPSYSSIHIIDSEVDLNGNYSLNGSFLPSNYLWSWDGDLLGTTVYSASQSGLNVQANGNLLFCETIPGRISEVDPSGNLVWSYENPIGVDSYTQGDVITEQDNQVFRAEKYPSNFIGFIGKDLTPTGIIENENSVSDACNLLSVADEENLGNKVVIYPNPVSQKFYIESQIQLSGILIFDINGRLVKEFDTSLDIFSIENLPSGLYVIKIISDKGMVIKKIIKG